MPRRTPNPALQALPVVALTLAVAASPPARAHGPVPAVLGEAAQDGTGAPWLLELSEGLARRLDDGSGRWAYECPQRWGNPITPVVASPHPGPATSGPPPALVVGLDGLMWLGLDGALVPASAPGDAQPSPVQVVAALPASGAVFVVERATLPPADAGGDPVKGTRVWRASPGLATAPDRATTEPRLEVVLEVGERWRAPVREAGAGDALLAIVGDSTATAYTLVQIDPADPEAWTSTPLIAAPGTAWPVPEGLTPVLRSTSRADGLFIAWSSLSVSGAARLDPATGEVRPFVDAEGALLGPVPRPGGGWVVVADGRLAQVPEGGGALAPLGEGPDGSGLGPRATCLGEGRPAGVGAVRPYVCAFGWLHRLEASGFGEVLVGLEALAKPDEALVGAFAWPTCELDWLDFAADGGLDPAGALPPEPEPVQGPGQGTSDGGCGAASGFAAALAPLGWALGMAGWAWAVRLRRRSGFGAGQRRLKR